MKILAFSPIKADGTSFYRGFGPLNHLKKTQENITITNGSVDGLEITWDLITGHDILFFQRPSMITETRVMELAKKCNRPIVIDYDDDYLSIPESNPRYELYADPHRVTHIRRAIEYADFIIVSTLSIKESIAERTGKSRSQIQVIPNGIDETLFDLTWLNNISLRDTILWRGGDTHDADMAMYLDKMVELYNDFPKLKWAFMGHAPEAFMAKIDPSRILLYPFEEIMTYFDRLFELRPMMTIVPWEENSFNRAKSCCSWLESTIAGAPCVFPKWSTEFVDGMVGYQDAEGFYRAASALITDQELRKTQYNLSHTNLCNRFTLEKLNGMRFEILHEMVASHPLSSKIGVKHPKYAVEPERYTDKQFFDYTWEHQLNQSFQHYADGHYNVAQWLYDQFKPTSVVELGCGPGPMIEKFCELKVPQVVGLEINPHFQEYFLKRNPHYKDCYQLQSFLEKDLFSGVSDLCISIEVFEHIPHDQLMPFIATMADHFKHFYFSSTPYRSTQRFDSQWGHQNIKTHEAWVKLFEENGFQYVGNPRQITIWDALFVSTRIGKAIAEALEEEHINQ